MNTSNQRSRYASEARDRWKQRYVEAIGAQVMSLTRHQHVWAPWRFSLTSCSLSYALKMGRSRHLVPTPAVPRILAVAIAPGNRVEPFGPRARTLTGSRLVEPTCRATLWDGVGGPSIGVGPGRDQTIVRQDVMER